MRSRFSDMMGYGGGAVTFWCAALIVWVVGSFAVQDQVRDKHDRSPGEYNAPAKVAERRRLHWIGCSGQAGLMVCVFLAIRNRRRQTEGSGQGAA